MPDAVTDTHALGIALLPLYPLALLPFFHFASEKD